MVVNDSEKKLSEISKALEDASKERDECLLYVKLLQQENAGLKKQYEEKSTASVRNGSSVEDSEVIKRIPDMLAKMAIVADVQLLGEAVHGLQSRIDSVSTMISGQMKSFSVAGKSTVAVFESLDKMEKLVKGHCEMTSTLIESARQTGSAIARTFQQVAELKQEVASLKEFVTNSQRDSERRMESMLDLKLSQALEKFGTSLNAKLHSETIPQASLIRHVSEPTDLPPVSTNMARVESMIPVESSSNPKARIETLWESKTDVRNLHTGSTTGGTPLSAFPDELAPVNQEDPEDDDEPTDSGFRIVSIPKPSENTASDLARSLTESQIRFSPQLSELEALGFKMRSLNSLLLNMHNGDMNKVVAELEKLQGQRV